MSANLPECHENGLWCLQGAEEYAVGDLADLFSISRPLFPAPEAFECWHSKAVKERIGGALPSKTF